MFSSSETVMTQHRLFIVDSSAFLSGKLLTFFEPMVTTESVKKELRRLGKEDVLSNYPNIIYTYPSEKDIESAKELAKQTGDLKRLSSTDIELIALAIKMKGTVVSDDYSIQNICKKAHIPYLSLSEKGISELVKWKLRCRGCGRYLDEKEIDEKTERCPVCGSKLRLVRRR